MIPDFFKFNILENEPYNIMDTLIKNHISEMAKKQNDFIKLKLTEKGFEHLIDNIEKRRFPKICFIKRDKWTYVYADNDTDEGFFIVAFEDYDFSTDYSEKDFSTKMNISFKWQDTLPLIQYKK